MQTILKSDFFLRFKKNKLAVIGIFILLLLSILAIGAPVFAPYPPDKFVSTIGEALPPSKKFIFGTDFLGRDYFSRALYGGRISLSVGFIAVGISVIIGLFFGATSGFYGGKVDTVIMRFVDVMLSFPSFFLIITVQALLTPSIFNVMAVIGLTSWMGVARLVRGEILSLKEMDFVSAAKALGANDLKIIWRHILPNSFAPVIVAATLGIANAILVESALSFLGLGVQPPQASWGNMLKDAMDSLQQNAGHLAIFPGVLIVVTVLAFNFVGDGLRDALDPKLK